MTRLSPNSEWNPSPLSCVPEHGNSHPKTRCFARQNAGLFAGGWGAEGVSALPVESIARKRMSFFCRAMCLPFVSRFFLGHCFGVKPTPGGTALFCFYGFHRNLVRKVHRKHFDKPTVNAELGTWESDPLAWLRRV